MQMRHTRRGRPQISTSTSSNVWLCECSQKLEKVLYYLEAAGMLGVKVCMQYESYADDAFTGCQGMSAEHHDCVQLN